jgi:glutathione synthase/RimK-type ligase-like ATP-grasp enzyme
LKSELSVQEYVPKKVELRVTVIGSKTFAVEIHSQEHMDSKHDWRRGDPLQLRHKLVSLPSDVEAHCIELVSTMGLAFSAIDLIRTPEDKYIFLEINPNGQWAWIQQVLPEVPLRETLADLLINGQNVGSDSAAR